MPQPHHDSMGGLSKDSNWTSGSTYDEMDVMGCWEWCWKVEMTEKCGSMVSNSWATDFVQHSP